MMDAYVLGSSNIVNGKKRGRVIDFKTGKIRDGEYDEQLEVYGMSGLLFDTEADEVTAELWFLDHGVIRQLEISGVPRIFTRAELPKLMKKWEKKAKPVLNDTIYAARPGDHCRWCFFRRSNGGPCQF
jgi:hypothetical protein